MNKQNSHKFEGGPRPLDDSWWAAVLAEEEERYGVYPNRSESANQGEGKVATPRPTGKPAPINWQHVQDVYEHDETLCMQVIGHNRGGLLVEGNGLQGFVPLSHLVDLPPEKPGSEEALQELMPLLAAYVGHSLRLKVIECDPDRGRIVLSERAALSEPGRRNQLLDTLKHGDCVTGMVTNITDFGVFVDMGGVEGLIHVSELSWGRVRHPSDAAKIGQEVEAFVINVDKERSRVALSLKRLRPNPWDTAEMRYQPGMEIEAIITSVVQFGAFARLEEGLDGLIHISEMSVNGEKVNPADLLCEGQQVKVRVLQVDAPRQRLGLSLSPENDL